MKATKRATKKVSPKTHDISLLRHTYNTKVTKKVTKEVTEGKHLTNRR
jgi:hypothetical protein